MSGQSPPIGYSSPGASGSRRPSLPTITSPGPAPARPVRSAQRGVSYSKEKDGSSTPRRSGIPSGSPILPELPTTPPLRDVVQTKERDVSSTTRRSRVPSGSSNHPSPLITPPLTTPPLHSSPVITPPLTTPPRPPARSSSITGSNGFFESNSQESTPKKKATENGSGGGTINRPSTRDSKSKRAHLVHEIVSTERSYANDLALIRDTYLSRYIRPTSLVSASDSTTASSETSRRSSIYTYQTAETKRSSELDLPLLVPSSKPPGADNPSTTSLILQNGGHGYSPANLGSGLGGMVTSVSTSSLAVVGGGGASSVRTTSGSSSIGSMAPPVGKPLSPADVRNVFLNLDQLAVAAEELANAMEAAMGDDTASPVGRDGEAGNDRLGEVFVNMVSLIISPCIAEPEPTSRYLSVV